MQRRTFLGTLAAGATAAALPAATPLIIDPQGPDPAGRLRYWVREHGFQGMRFSPIYHPNATWLNSKEHYPLWREAERLGAVFNFYILPQQMPMLEDMAGPAPP